MASGYEKSDDYGGPDPHWTEGLGIALFILIVLGLPWLIVTYIF
jgi:hypothetical protein